MTVPARKTAEEIHEAARLLNELKELRDALNSLHVYTFHVKWTRGTQEEDALPYRKHFPKLFSDWLRAHYLERREAVVEQLHSMGVEA